jgi:hypothetical protein
MPLFHAFENWIFSMPGNSTALKVSCKGMVKVYARMCLCLCVCVSKNSCWRACLYACDYNRNCVYYTHILRMCQMLTTELCTKQLCIQVLLPNTCIHTCVYVGEPELYNMENPRKAPNMAIPSSCLTTRTFLSPDAFVRTCTVGVSFDWRYSQARPFALRIHRAQT